MTTTESPDPLFLEWVQSAQEEYVPSEKVREALAEKALVTLVGPFAIGKSSLSQTIAEIDPAFSEMNTISTRERRRDDPEHYRTGMPREEFIKKMVNGELVQFEAHPTTGQLYGSDLASFPTDRIVTPALAGSLRGFEDAGFGEIIPVGIVADTDVWQAWLRERREKSDYKQRLHEAKESLEWLQQELALASVPIIENVPNSTERPSRIRATARDIIAIANGDTSVKMVPYKARGLMDMMKVTATRELQHGNNE